nr:InlB B-repeat-containing protein [Bifidobacterium sp. SO1]
MQANANRYGLGASNSWFVYRVTFDDPLKAQSATITTTVVNAGSSTWTRTDTGSSAPAANTGAGDSRATLSYDGNGAETGSTPSQAGTVGSTQTVQPNGYSHAGYSFTGWNTKKDGSGRSYRATDTLTLPREGLILYAQWRADAGSLPETGGESHVLPWILLHLFDRH